MKKLIKPLVVRYIPPQLGQAAQAGYWVYKAVYEYNYGSGWQPVEEAPCGSSIVVVPGQSLDPRVYGNNAPDSIYTSLDPCTGSTSSSTYVRITYVKDYYVPAVPYRPYVPAQYVPITPRGFSDYALSVAALTADVITTLTVEVGGAVRVVDSTTETSLYEATLLGGEITTPAGTSALAGPAVLNILPTGGVTYVWVNDAPGSLRMLATAAVKAYGAPYDETSSILAAEAPAVEIGIGELLADIDMVSSVDFLLLGQLDMVSVASVTGVNYLETSAQVDMQSTVETIQWGLLAPTAQLDATGTVELQTFVHGRARLRMGQLGMAGTTTYVGDFVTALQAVVAAPSYAMNVGTTGSTAVGDFDAALDSVHAANLTGNYTFDGTLVYAAEIAAHYGTPNIVSSTYATYAQTTSDATLLAAITDAVLAMELAGYDELAAMLHVGTDEYVISVAGYLAEAVLADPALAAYDQLLVDAIAAMVAYATNDPLAAYAASVYVATAFVIADGTADAGDVMAHYAAGAALDLETSSSVIAAAAAFYNDLAANETDATVLAYQQYVLLAGAYSALQDSVYSFGPSSLVVGDATPSVGRLGGLAFGSTGTSMSAPTINYGTAQLTFGSRGTLPVGGIASGAARMTLWVLAREDDTASVGSAGRSGGLDFDSGGTGRRVIPGADLLLVLENRSMRGMDLSMAVTDSLLFELHGGLEVGGQLTMGEVVIFPLLHGGLEVGGQLSMLPTLQMLLHGGLEIGGQLSIVSDTLVLVVTETSDARGNPRRAVTRLDLGRVLGVEYGHDGTVYVLTPDGLYTLTGAHADAAVQFQPLSGRRIRINHAWLEGKGTMKMSIQAAGGAEYQYTAPLDPLYPGKVRVPVGRGITGQQLEVGVRLSGDAELASAETEVIDV